MSKEQKLSKPVEELMLFQEDSHAQTSQAQTTTLKESPGRGRAYGQSSSESYGIYDQDMQSWRTYQRCLLGGWEKLSETWHPSGMTRNGKVFRLRGLKPPTGVRESGLLPTLRASDGMRLYFKVSSLQKVVNRNRNAGTAFSLSMPELITLVMGGKIMKASFAETMMGLPKNWTDLKCVGTAKSFKSLNGSEKE